MITRTFMWMAVGIIALAAASLIASLLNLVSLKNLWSPAWTWVAQGIFAVATVVALVWSTGLARSHGLSALKTGALALAIGVGVMFTTSLLVEITIWPLWNALPFPAWDPAYLTTQLDARWATNKVAECAVYALPFVLWRAWQARGRVVAA